MKKTATLAVAMAVPALGAAAITPAAAAQDPSEVVITALDAQYIGPLSSAGKMPKVQVEAEEVSRAFTSMITYKTVAKAVSRGTEFVGLSDFTAFQNALLAKTGAVSWAGPVVGEDFGAADGPDDIMEACFEDLIDGQGEGTGWRLPARDGEAPVLRHVHEAVLWGGNLSVLVSLLGTPYFPAVDKGVLFLEDVHEHPYRLERMLDQLRHAGVLARQRAVVLGLAQFCGSH